MRLTRAQIADVVERRLRGQGTRYIAFALDLPCRAIRTALIKRGIPLPRPGKPRGHYWEWPNTRGRLGWIKSQAFRHAERVARQREVELLRAELGGEF